jgi:hypothetical protein
VNTNSGASYTLTGGIVLQAFGNKKIQFNGYTTANGIPYFSSTGLITSTAQGASNTLLHGNGASAPTFSAVSLTADVTSTLPVANGGTGRATVTIGALQKGGATTTSALVDAVANVDYLKPTGTPTSGSIVSYLSSTPTWNTFSSLASGDFLYWNGSNWANRTIIASGLLNWNASTATISTVNRPHTIFTPTTGGTVTLVSGQINIINPAGTLATLTLALPASPSNNDIISVAFTQAITSVSYSGGTVVGSPTSSALGGQWYLTYDSGSSTWY